MLEGHAGFDTAAVAVGVARSTVALTDQTSRFCGTSLSCMNDEMDLASLGQAAAETLLPEEGGKGVADGHYKGRVGEEMGEEG